MNHPGMIIVDGQTASPCANEFFLGESETQRPLSEDDIRKSVIGLLKSHTDVVAVLTSAEGETSVLLPGKSGCLPIEEAVVGNVSSTI